jgi:hypothetical protein
LSAATARPTVGTRADVSLSNDQRRKGVPGTFPHSMVPRKYLDAVYH